MHEDRSVHNPIVLDIAGGPWDENQWLQKRERERERERGGCLMEMCNAWPMMEGRVGYVLWAHKIVVSPYLVI